MELKRLTIPDIEKIQKNTSHIFRLPDAFALNSARNLIYYCRQTRGWKLHASTDYEKREITITRIA